MPERPVVSNTSPLLYLHQIDQLDLLRSLYGEVVVPAAVAGELARGAELGIDVPDLDRYAWLQVEPPASVSCFARWSTSVLARFEWALREAAESRSR